jgi:NAD(P)-dependent dehydrogenase (short-subunit alcohol dehydrogenase family)
MLLKRKTAVVYGAGSIGGSVARAFARQGARVEIASRSLAAAEALAAEIDAGGGAAGAHQVDALDEGAVRAFVDGVAAARGSVDVSFNLISVGDVQGTPLVEMEWQPFAMPIERAVRSTFNTVKAAAPHMARQEGGGAVLLFGGEGDPVPDTIPDVMDGGEELTASLNVSAGALID